METLDAMDHSVCMPDCPTELLVKFLSGKWKLQILYFAFKGNVRFNTLLRRIPGSNKQSIAVALRDMEEAGVLEKRVIKQKPLHIEYAITEQGKALYPIFMRMGIISKDILQLKPGE